MTFSKLSQVRRALGAAKLGTIVMDIGENMEQDLCRKVHRVEMKWKLLVALVGKLDPGEPLSNVGVFCLLPRGFTRLSKAEHE